MLFRSLVALALLSVFALRGLGRSVMGAALQAVRDAPLRAAASDRRKARGRRERWFVGGEVSSADEARASAAAPASDPEHRLLSRERRARLAGAIGRLDGRQRTVFMLCHYGDCTPREVSVMTGLNESTVRVHLFRAARKLRGLLGGQP